MTTETLSHKTLISLLKYEPISGNFVWLKTRCGGAKAGKIAGSLSQWRGATYKVIRVLGKTYFAHRLAWFYVHKFWPIEEIDHINKNTLDNRMENLREANRRQNCLNKKIRKDNTSGIKGVSFRKDTQKWRVQIQDKFGRQRTIGYFLSIQEAAEVRDLAAQLMHGDFYSEH